MAFTVRDMLLFSYPIASADMRYIAINERKIYLRSDPESGPIIRGEVPDCGPTCYAFLAQVLLEYSMSCEGCRDQAMAADLVVCTGERLGKVLAARLFQDASAMPAADQVAVAFEFVLNSLSARYAVERTGGDVRYTLEADPFLQAATETRLTRGLDAARQGFWALCKSLLHALAPDWTLADMNAPITVIALSLPPVRAT